MLIVTAPEVYGVLLFLWGESHCVGQSGNQEG